MADDIRIDVHVTDGSVHSSSQSSGEVTQESMKEFHNLIQKIGLNELDHFTLTIDGNKQYFNPKHIVSIKITLPEHLQIED